MSKKRNPFIFSFFLTFILIFLTNHSGNAATLNDIPGQYATEINFLLNKGVITGYPDGTFKPDNYVTRQEAATIIGRAKGLDNTKRTTSFPDVDPASFASGYIQSAYEAGIITGYVDHTFRPTNPITRGEMAYLLQRAFNLNKASNVYFADLSGTGSQYDVIDRIATAGLTNGFPDGTYRPEVPITRVQYALFVARGLNQEFRVSVSPVVADERPIIAIDPGHGGSDPGAIGVNGLQEKELNLSVALKVESILKQKDIRVVMTRRNDTYPTLSERVNIATNSNADTFVSIHANSATASAAGTETFYSTASTRANDSKQLASFIQNRLYPALGTKNRGVKTGDFFVIYRNPLPSALVELGFITNSGDASKLSSDYYRDVAAEAIANGILDYYYWYKTVR